MTLPLVLLIWLAASCIAAPFVGRFLAGPSTEEGE